MDQVILSRLPPDVWQRVERAGVEVWAVPEVEGSDVDALIKLWLDFRFFSWEPNFGLRVDLAEIRDFWTSQTGESKNLYMVR